LKLNNNGLGPAGGATIANALRESARLSQADGKPSNLRTVICGRNRLEDGSAPAWAEAFAAHGSLIDVRMPQNGIRMDGIAALAHGLAQCPNLKHLDLQDNTFSQVGSEAMAKALPKWKDLEVLNFSDCVLAQDAEEGLEISAVIKVISEGHNSKLQTLQLQNNNLESATFTILAEGVSKLLKLKALELQWNEVDDKEDDGLQTITATLKQRGGKLYLDDEDEDEDEDVVGGGAEAGDEEPGEQTLTTEKETDDLADLLSKVSIK
jgi:Ran GTPase-activating protein 1